MRLFNPTRQIALITTVLSPYGLVLAACEFFLPLPAWYHFTTVGLFPQFSCSCWPDLDPKWVRLAPNWSNPGLFQIIFQYILRSDFSTFWRYAKSDLKKSRIWPIWGQSDPFWVQIWSPRMEHIDLPDFKPGLISSRLHIYLWCVYRFWLDWRT